MRVWTPILVVVAVVVGSVLMAIAIGQRSDEPLTEEDCADGCTTYYGPDGCILTLIGENCESRWLEAMSTEGCPVEISEDAHGSIPQHLYTADNLMRCAYIEDYNRRWTDNRGPE